MNAERYEVRVEKVFEGPMDLLVFLIKKHEVDICDIPIAMITDQFLAHIEWMRSLNIDVAGDFLLMASTLTQIKSRMLLPLHAAGEEEEEDPRLEIVRPLAEYLRMKAAAEALGARPLLEDAVFRRRPPADEVRLDPAEQVVEAGLFELIDAFSRVVRQASLRTSLTFEEERVSIRDRIGQIVDFLEARGTASFRELFAPGAGKDQMIVTFLAILEMARLELIRVVQEIPGGAIRIQYQ